MKENREKCCQTSIDKKRLRSPLIFYGGKGKMVAKLLKHVPPHRIYVEVFGGAAWLLFAKQPSPIEVYNDINGTLVNFFRVLRDPKKFRRFYKLVTLTPYSREEQNFCFKHLDEGDDVERAYRLFVALRQGFGGHYSSWGYDVNNSTRGIALTIRRYLSVIEVLPDIHARFMRVQIDHDDFRKVIPRYDTDDTFFYLDPPYVPEAMKAPQITQKTYRFMMTVQDHEDLVRLLLTIKGKALLSGYRHPVYEPLEQAGWRRVDYETVCHAAGRTRLTKMLGEGAVKRMQPRTESLWMNYEL